MVHKRPQKALPHHKLEGNEGGLGRAMFVVGQCPQEVTGHMCNVTGGGKVHGWNAQWRKPRGTLQGKMCVMRIDAHTGDGQDHIPKATTEVNVFYV